MIASGDDERGVLHVLAPGLVIVRTVRTVTTTAAGRDNHKLKIRKWKRKNVNKKHPKRSERKKRRAREAQFLQL